MRILLGKDPGLGSHVPDSRVLLGDELAPPALVPDSKTTFGTPQLLFCQFLNVLLVLSTWKAERDL